MKHRPERMSELIRETLAEAMLRELELPGELVTITEVEVSKDLEYAKIKVSILPHTAEEAVMHALKKLAGHFQGLLIKKLNLKPIPHITFVLDEGLERAAALEKEFIEIEKKDSNRE